MRGEELIEGKDSKIKLKDRKEEIQRNKKRKEREGEPPPHSGEPPPRAQSQSPSSCRLPRSSLFAIVPLSWLRSPPTPLFVGQTPSPTTNPSSPSSASPHKAFQPPPCSSSTSFSSSASFSSPFLSPPRFVLGLEADGGFGRRKGKKAKEEMVVWIARKVILQRC